MRLGALKDILVALVLLGSVTISGVVVARDLGQAVAVMKTCQGRGQAAYCHEPVAE